MSDTNSLAGKGAWVNGGAGAVGLACCIEFARAGARVVMSGRNAAGLDKAMSQTAGNGRIESLLIDVSQSRSVLALTESINMEECVNGIRATSISPAGIDTPLLDKRPQPPSAEMRAGLLKPKDIADVCVYIAALPPHVCINEILMSPTLNSAYLGELETQKRR